MTNQIQKKLEKVIKEKIKHYCNIDGIINHIARPNIIYSLYLDENKLNELSIVSCTAILESLEVEKPLLSYDPKTGNVERVVALPEKKETPTYRNWTDIRSATEAVIDGYNQAIDEIKKSLQSQGIKVKGEQNDI